MSEKVELLRHAMTPRTDAEGRPLTKILPYLPIKDPCQLCPAKCCKLVVKVSVPDAVHYCRTLGVPFFAGLTLAASTDEKRGFLLDRDPRVVAPEAAWPGRGEIQLRRRENGYCQGLVEVGGYERCGVYGARPTFCRTYPVSWTAETVQGGPPAILCPVPYALPPDVEANFKADIERQIDLWALHDRLVLEWNQASDQPRTIEAWLPFVLGRAGAELGVAVDPIITEGDGSQRLYEAMIEAKVLPPNQLASLVPGPRIFAGLAGAPKSK
ncbi:MAG: YkgJ family cysteine cluster protein [Deltaproteobacteria bacterium]|nr:YkgJ family cysteine cluster protein [Deltaproteobacteria bacterium]